MPRFAVGVSVFLLSFSLSFAQEGVLIGQLPTLFHGVSGMLYGIDESNFCIQEFFYDGQGPDAFLYFYYPQDTIDDTGGGVYIPITDERAQFVLGRAYDNETFCFTLPDAYRGCDFGGFGIWCRYANQLFTNITWTTADIYSETDMADRITCSTSPGRGYVGVLPTLLHDVGGRLFVRDSKTFVIRNFTYDGGAPAVFVYLYRIGDPVGPSGGGIIIPRPINNGEEGRFDGTVYTGLPMDDLVITIPDDMDLFTCDIGTFTIWCREFELFFTNIAIDGELFTNNRLERDYEPNRIFCDRPDTRPGVYVGELPTTDPRAISGSFYVQDQYTFFIQLFSYDASRENVFIYVFKVGTPVTDTGDDGIKVSVSETDVGFPSGRMNSYFNQDFTVDLRRAEGGPIMACELGYFAIIDTSAGERLTKIIIPKDIFSDGDDDEDKIRCGTISLLSSTLSLLGALLAATFLKA